MARGVNKVILVGNLGQDPELTYTPNGLAVARFSIATAERRKSQEGEWTDHTEWHKIVTFGKTAESAGEFLKKGRQVYIEGRIQTRNYEKDGIRHYFTEIITNNWIMLGRRDEAGRPVGAQPSEESTPGESQADNGAPESDVEDDLPF